MSPLMSTTLASSPFIETDITYSETKEYSYLFNATEFDPAVCRIRITKQTKQKPMHFAFNKCLDVRRIIS